MRVVGDIARLGAKRHGGRIAVTLGERELSYTELNAKANRLANALQAQGVSGGERVALLALNGFEFLIVAAATAKLGAVLLPINFRYQTEELVYIVNDAAPSVLFAGPQFAELVAGAADSFEAPVKLVLLAGRAAEPWLAYGDLVAGGDDSEPGAVVDAASPAALMYTSGTTGRPKGVLFAHAAYMATFAALVVEGDLGGDDVTMVNLPLFHQAGLNALVLPTLMVGGRVVLTEGAFEPGRILEAAARHRVTMTMWVPTMLAMLLSAPDLEGYDLSALDKIWYGSSPISPTVLEGAKAAFRAGFYQWYGQTETGMISVLRPQDHGERASFTGREVFNAELRIVDEAGADVATGEVGEVLCATGLHGMIGYFNNDAATAETVRGGWIHTGDLARAEAGGYFTIVDRLGDMIISGAENVYPKEIEDTIAGHPAVREVAVFGIPDEVYGESVCAVVALKDGAGATAEEIIGHCAEKLAGFKKPKRVDFMDELPKNAMGKITKNVLRNPHWEGRESRV